MTLREQKNLHNEQIKIVRSLTKKDSLTEQESRTLNSAMEQAEKLKNQIETKMKAQALELQLQKEPEDPPWAKEKRTFSFRSVIDALDGKRFEGFEREVSDELSRRIDAPGILVPDSVVFGEPIRPKESRTINDETSLFSDPVRFDQYLPFLREASIMGRCGMGSMSSVGRFSIPRVSVGSTAGFFSGTGGANAGDAIDISDPDFGSIESRPLFQAVMSSWSLAQVKNMSAGASIEQFVREDLSGAMAELLDDKIVSGTGADGQPKGLRNQTGITTVDKTVGGSPPKAEWTHSELLGYLKDFKVASKSHTSGIKWLLNPTIESELKSKLKFAVNGSQQLMSDSNMIEGVPAVVSNHLAGSTTEDDGLVELILGAFKWFTFCSYGALSFELGRQSDDFQRGITRLKCTLCYDLILRRSEFLE